MKAEAAIIPIIQFQFKAEIYNFMSRVSSNQLFKWQQGKLSPSTFKRATISSVNVSARTANVFFIENPQTIIKNIPLASTLDPNTIAAGMTCRVDTFSETKAGSMVISYVLGQLAKTSALTLSTIPTTSSSAGIKGQVAWSTTYFYICIDTNTWRRASLASF